MNNLTNAQPKSVRNTISENLNRKLFIPGWQKVLLNLGVVLALFLSVRLIQVVMNHEASDLGGVVLLVHAGVALLASMLTAWMLLSPKGTPIHKVMGRLWSGLLIIIAVSSFWLRDGIGATMGIPFGIGPIHILSVLTIVAVIEGIVAIRKGKVDKHVKQMVIVCWALLIAGAFTLIPGRFMQELAFFAL